MRRRLFSIAAVLLVSLMMVLSVNAAEYGLIYDETDLLWSEEIETLGTETLPEFTKAHQIDMRVDVLTGIGDFENLADTAAGLYENYDYGSETDGNAVTLTVLVHEDETGAALEDWYIYLGGEDTGLTESSAGDYLTAEAWDGDYEQDAQMLAKAITAMLSDVEASIGSSTKETIITDLYTGETIENSEPEEIPSTGNGLENWKDKEAQLGHITDSAALLTEEQCQTLEQKAKEIEEAYGFGVYVVTVDNYLDYSNYSVMDAATSIYQNYSLGTGESKDGLMLLLSMSDRDYSLITHGDFGNYAFNDAGREKMTEFFLDDFGDNDWYAGFSEYLTWSEDYLETAKNGEPYSSSNMAMSTKERNEAIMIRILVILIAPLIVAAIYIKILSSKMKSVAEATKAGAYISGDLNLTTKIDKFKFVTQSKVKITTNDSDSGGTRSRSSGGFSGTSGKF